MQEVLIIPKTELLELIRREFERFQEESRPKEEFFTTAQAAKMLRMSEVGVRKARREGRLKGQQANAKSWMYARSELENFLNRFKHD